MKTLKRLYVSPTPWWSNHIDGNVLDNASNQVLTFGGRHDDENIKLIAAAPDLYEVARALVDDFAKAGTMELCDLIDKAEAALKKAGGAE